MSFEATDLSPHPEGGSYREVYRSSNKVVNTLGENKCALTHIYFSLTPDEQSRFHRVGCEEVWNLYKGRGVRLWLLYPESETLQEVELSEASNRFCFVVPAGVWQAAEPIQGEVLVGCSVAPGFEFDDFELMPEGHAFVKLLQSQQLDHLC